RLSGNAARARGLDRAHRGGLRGHGDRRPDPRQVRARPVPALERLREEHRPQGPGVRFALDHVVIAVGDLEQAIADYRSLGFTVAPGGRHPGRTSHNALIVFEDGAYIELIAWTAPNDAERWNVMHRKHGDGFMDFALI